MSVFDRSGGGDDRFSGERVTIRGRDDEPGVTVVDRIERRQYPLRTPDSVTPRPADTGQCLFPVDTAVEVEAGSIELPNVVVVCVRDAGGEMLAQAEQFAHETFPEGTYSVELDAPIKIYLQANAPLTVLSDAERTRIEFDGDPTLVVGARSHHDRPAATVTTPDTPESLMRTVSTFGSALKTLSPERSFPTLRGHPPAVELGDSLSIPPALDPPDTGMRIEVPPERSAIYTVAPLAYYLGATVVSGESPRLVTDHGFEYSLGATDTGLETGVERALERTFLLDCVTRTEGFFEVDLHERRALEAAVDLDFAALYDRPIAERTRRHLDVEYDAIAEHVPTWKLTAHVRPTPVTAECLPFLVDELAAIRPSGTETTGLPDLGQSPEGTALGEGLVRGEAAAEAGFVQPPETDSLEQAWIGRGAPIGASKPTPSAFRNRLGRQSSDDSIDITVVCNEERMREEETVVGYGNRDRLPFDVTVKNALTIEELRSTVSSSTDFLHYIGHIDATGFRCTDGRLDATDLEAVGVDAFLLNACHSYDQGMALIDAGAIGGIVTLDEVVDSGAVRMGRALSRLLDRGFSLGAALEVARGESIVGGQYLVVGDGSLSITQAESGTPHVCSIRSREDGNEFEMTIETYPTSSHGLGTVFTPHLEDCEQYYLTSGVIDTFSLSEQELAQFFSLQNVPVFVNDRLRWSGEMTTEGL